MEKRADSPGRRIDGTASRTYQPERSSLRYPEKKDYFKADKLGQKKSMKRSWQKSLRRKQNAYPGNPASSGT